MELLSPAGNWEALEAAVSCGADAVYLGYTSFGARSFAGNFNEEQLKEAVEYAHENGRKIFVTVNTLVKQNEIPELYQTLEILSRSMVDAVLVQDLGTASIISRDFPELALHASTQMTVNNLQGALLLKKYGFKRVVPARECSLQELQKISESGLEVEAFAHGALCVAVSGQCLFSSMIGGRSGNRGKCAQPCRLKYRLNDGTLGYLLSTRDLMLIDKVDQMKKAGVYSFKLEGRMKRPEYVGIVTRAYREAIDAAEQGKPYKASEETIEELRQIFNRGGFTEGYVMGQSNHALMSWEKPNHWGIPVGRIVSSKNGIINFSCLKDLHKGDNLQIRGNEEKDISYNGEEKKAGENAFLSSNGFRGAMEDTIYRLTDALQMEKIRERIAAGPSKIAVKAVLKAYPGTLPVLELSDSDGNSVTIEGSQIVQTASQHPLDHDAAFKQISKMGGTAYQLEDLKVYSENTFLPNSVLNELRRDAVGKLRKLRIGEPPESRRREYKEEKKSASPVQKNLIVQAGKPEHFEAYFEAGADWVYWYPQSYLRKDLEQGLVQFKTGRKAALVLPAVTYTRCLNDLQQFVSEHTDRISAVVANNIGHLEYDWPVCVIAGQGLNVMNCETAKFYSELGVQNVTASCELSAKEMKEISSCGIPFQAEVYGRTQLMLLSHCPRRTERGDTVQDSSCNLCGKDGGCPGIYEDRMHMKFPLRRIRFDTGCILRLYNSVVTDMAKKENLLKELDCSWILSFTDETEEKRLEVIRSYRNLLDGGNALHVPDASATTGHMTRPIE